MTKQVKGKCGKCGSLKLPKEDELKAIVTVIANLVYKYQGSDPDIIAKQIGIDNAVATLKEIISQLLLDQDKQKEAEFEEKWQFREASIKAMADSCADMKFTVLRADLIGQIEEGLILYDINHGKSRMKGGWISFEDTISLIKKA